MSTDWTEQDREFATELLADPTLSEEDAIHLMDQMDAYDQRLEDKQRRDHVNAQWAAKIDRSPTPAPQRPDRSAPGGGVLGVSGQEISQFVNPPSQENPDIWVKAANAAEAGVDVTTGLRPQARGKAGLLAFDKESQWGQVASTLRDEYTQAGVEIPEGMPLVFEDESTGMPMYMRLTDEGKLKPTLVNPPGTDSGDFLEFAGEIPTFALETIGGVAGGALGLVTGNAAGTVVGGTAGAAAGGAISIPLRVKIAEMVGADPSVLDKIKTGDAAAWQGLLSGAGELFGFAVTGASSALRNFFGRSLEVDDLPAMEDEIRRRLALVDDLERRRAAGENVPDNEIVLTLGELTGDADILTAEANLLNQQQGKFARKMRAQEIRTDKAQRQALRDLATQRVRAPTDDGFRSVETVSEDVRDTLATQPRTELEGIQARAQNELTTAEQAARVDATLDDAYAMRDNIHAHAGKMKEAEGIAWDNYRRTIRWDPQTRQSAMMIDNRGKTPIREVAERLQADQQNALLRSLQNAYRGTLENMGFPPGQVDEMVDADALAGFAQPLLDPFHLHMALSHMKKELRLLNAGDTSRGWEAGDLAEVIEAIEATMKGSEMISRQTGKPLANSTRMAVRDAWTTANLTSRRLHNLLDTENMRYLLETRVKIGPDGTDFEMPNVPAGLMMKRLFTPNDSRALIETMEAVGFDPNIRVALVNQLRRAHADTALPGGRWNQTAHNKFVADYEDHMRYLGIDPDIDNIAQFGRQFDELTTELNNFNREMGAIFGKNVVDPTKPLDIATEVLSNSMNYKQVKNAMNTLDSFDPRLANEVREQVLNKLDMDLTSSNNQLLNPAKLRETLRGQRETLSAMFGRQYVQDLDALAAVADLVGERTFRRSTKELMQSPLTALTRSLFGPLSKKQRFLTAVQRVARNSRANSVQDLLRDPTKLRQFIRLQNLSIKDPRYWVIVRGLGLAQYMSEDNPFEEFALSNDLREEFALRGQEFDNGTLQREKEERETPRRYGTKL